MWVLSCEVVIAEPAPHLALYHAVPAGKSDGRWGISDRAARLAMQAGSKPGPVHRKSGGGFGHGDRYDVNDKCQPCCKVTV